MSSGLRELELGDWPGGHLLVMDCRYLEPEKGALDLALPIVCEEHGRTVWWCPTVRNLWCDTGPPVYEPHTWPRT